MTHNLDGDHLLRTYMRFLLYVTYVIWVNVPRQRSAQKLLRTSSQWWSSQTPRWIKAWAGQGWNTKYLSVPGFIGFVCAPRYVGGGWTRYDLINTNWTNWSNWSNRRHTTSRSRADKVRPPINQGLVFRSNAVQNLWISMSWFLELVIWHEFSLIPLIKHKRSNLLLGYVSRIELRSSATNTGKHKFTFHPSSYPAILLIFRSWC